MSCCLRYANCCQINQLTKRRFDSVCARVHRRRLIIVTSINEWPISAGSLVVVTINHMIVGYTPQTIFPIELALRPELADLNDISRKSRARTNERWTECLLNKS